MLYTALIILSDEAYDDVESHGDVPVENPDDVDWLIFGRLPKITWNQPAAWRREFARAANDLADDLAEGRWPIPTNTMEEMARYRGCACAVADDPG